MIWHRVCFTNDSIEAPGVFKISDALYEDFVMFLSDKEYEYETNTEKKMAELIDKAEDEYADFKEDLEVLQKKLLTIKKMIYTIFNHNTELILRIDDRVTIIKKVD